MTDSTPVPNTCSCGICMKHEPIEASSVEEWVEKRLEKLLDISNRAVWVADTLARIAELKELQKWLEGR